MEAWHEPGTLDKCTQNQELTAQQSEQEEPNGKDLQRVLSQQRELKRRIRAYSLYLL